LDVCLLAGQASVLMPGDRYGELPQNHRVLQPNGRPFTPHARPPSRARDSRCLGDVRLVHVVLCGSAKCLAKEAVEFVAVLGSVDDVDVVRDEVVWVHFPLCEFEEGGVRQTGSQLRGRV